MGFKRFYTLYQLCKDQEKRERQESRWTGAWISFLLLKMFSKVKESWETFATNLGVIDPKENAYYTRIQKKKDLDHAHRIGEIHSAYKWGRGKSKLKGKQNEQRQDPVRIRDAFRPDQGESATPAVPKEVQESTGRSRRKI